MSSMQVLLMAVLAALSALALVAAWWLRPRPAGLPRQGPAEQLQATWRLWVCFLLSGLFASAVASLLFGQPGESTIGYALRVLLPRSGTDSWYVMLKASAHLREHPEVPIYQALFFDEHRKFQYPLTSLLMLDIPQALAPVGAGTMVLVFQVISRLCVPAIGVVFAMLMTHAATHGVMGERVRLSRPSRWLMAVVGIASVMLFYPLSRSEHLGQIQTMMSLAAALALLAWQRNKPGWAGVFMGLCCVIKPHWGFVILWALLRRQWRFALAAVLTACAFLAVTVAFYGLRNVLDYLPVVSYIGKHGESFYANQSVNGLMNRLLFNGSNLVWSDNSFAPFHPLVYGATLASSILLLGFALFWNRSTSPKALDLALVVVALTMASPIAWEHHYGFLLPVFALALPAILRQPTPGGWMLPLLWLAYLLTSQSLTRATNLLADTPWNFVQSHLFFGALLVLALLFRLSWLAQRGDAIYRAGVLRPAA
jgi:alpha-1,2-mannosyltransferase